MNSSVGSQTETQISRTLIESFEREFALLDDRTRELLQKVPVAILYEATMLSGGVTSVGDSLLKSAGTVEQTFGGLTANLWDDPFEWTLPETLSTPALITEYLGEVCQTRNNFFTRLREDRDLTKLIVVPSGGTQPLIQLLLDTLVRAAGYLERASVILAVNNSSNH